MRLRGRRAAAVGALLLLAAAGGGAHAAPDAEARADHIAERVRSAQALDTPAARQAALRLAAAQAAALAATLDPASGLWRRLQCDRLLALSLAGDHFDAAGVFDRIRGAGHALRPYAVRAAVESLLAAGRTDEGERLLLSADAHDRLDFGLRLARMERWDEDFDASARRLQALAQAFPGDAQVRREQAALERQRGRPRAALALLGAAEAAEDRELAAEAWLDLGRSDRAAPLVAGRAAGPAARRLAQLRAGRGAVAAGYANSRSPAIASPNGAEEVGATIRVDSARLDERWRVGAQATTRRAEFQGRQPEARYAGVRLTHHATGGEASLELGRSFDDFIERDYAVLDAGYWLADGLRLAARAALDDPEGPLQARASGIGIDSLSIGGTWRPEPAWRLDAALGGARFDDGNRRRFASLSGEHRAYVNGAAVTSVFGSAYGARNSEPAAPYFNPASAYSLELGLVQRFGAWLGGEQRLRPSVAYAWQRGFGAHAIPLFDYTLRLPAGGGWFEWSAGISRPVYDGQRETRYSLALSYAWGAP